MPGFTFTNRGLYTLLSNQISGSTDIRQAVFKGTVPTSNSVRDMNTLADLKAVATEATASGYARADLSGVTVDESDASDIVVLSASAPVYSTVAVGETWTFVAYYIEGASDSARTLLAIDEPTSPRATTGGNVTGPQLYIEARQG